MISCGVGEGISEGSKGEKRCEAPDVLPPLQAHRLAQFHGCWQKTGDSWVRDKGGFVAAHRGVGISCFHRLPLWTPTPSLYGADWKC